MNKEYQHLYVNAVDWAEIQAWYAELTDQNQAFKPYLDLVTHIINSELSARLYAYTSVHKLVISIYEKIEWNSEALHLEYNYGAEDWIFEYYPKPLKPIEFKRRYDDELVIEKLNKTIGFLNW